MRIASTRGFLFLVVLCMLSCSVLKAEDVLGFRGTDRDGVCKETGLLQEWPEDGPALLWKVEGVGEGYSNPVIEGNIVYVSGHEQQEQPSGQAEGDEKKEPIYRQCVYALDIAHKGMRLWKGDFGPITNKGANYPGIRSTPTIDGDYLYIIGIGGEITCMKKKDGSVVWQKEMTKDFGGNPHRWGFAESVLIDGDLAICSPGGKDNTMVALNKKTGEKVWSSAIGDAACYSSAIKATYGGMPQYINLMQKGIISVDAATGKFLWRYDAPASKMPNCSACIASQDTIFGGSGYGNGSGMAKITKEGDEFKAEQVYFSKKMQNHHGGMVLVNGCVFGSNDPDTLVCLDHATGEVKWSDKSCGKGSTLYADGMIYYRNEKGPISLVKATGDGFELKGRFTYPNCTEKNCWPYLVIADGKMYIRDQGLLLCYEVKKK